MRIGHAYDAHQFGQGTFIRLGGIKIPHNSGIIAYSDGDLLLHALSDALLGAAGLGDIGKYFPNKDKECKGLNSKIIVQEVFRKLCTHGFNIVNIDSTIITQEPKIYPFIAKMCLSIANTLNIKVQQVNVKAKTTDSLGFTGRKEGIAVHVVALISSKNNLFF